MKMTPAVLCLFVGLSTLAYTVSWMMQPGMHPLALAMPGLFGVLFTAFGILGVRGVFHAARRRRDFAPGSPVLRGFLRGQVPTLRQLGFFGEHSGAKDDQVVQTIATRIEEEWGDRGILFVYDPENLAKLDPARCLPFDDEMEPWPGDGGYAALLNKAAAISRGHFNPVEIVESAGDDGELIHVAFQDGSRYHKVVLRDRGNMMDITFMSFLAEVSASPAGGLIFPWIDDGQWTIHISTADRIILTERLGWSL